MKQQRTDMKQGNKTYQGRPEIRDNLDSRKNEEYKSKGDIKKAEVQKKEKQKNNKREV